MLGCAQPQGWRPSLTQNHRRLSAKTRGMYVPSDSFGGVSPERKASQALEKLFTFISAKVILAQLEGSGRGALAAYNQEQYTTLFNHLHDVPLNEPDRWLEQLMRKDKALALRLMEVRAAYSQEDFEWDQLQRLSVEGIKRSNLQLMRKAATASLQATQQNSVQPAERAVGQQQTQVAKAQASPATLDTAAVQREPQQGQSRPVSNTASAEQQLQQKTALEGPESDQGAAKGRQEQLTDSSSVDKPLTEGSSAVVSSPGTQDAQQSPDEQLTEQQEPEEQQ